VRRPSSRQDPIQGEFRAPASKPETQRAIVMASLADGVTRINHPLVARETTVMIEACRALGAKVAHLDDRLEVSGIGPACDTGLSVPGPVSGRYIWASGSALVARLFLTIGSALPEDVIVDGKCNLRVRPFKPLLTALKDKGVEFRFFDTADRLPCLSAATSLPGGRYLLRTDISSQFTTALAISAPLADEPVSIELTGPNYSISYIKQTTDMMSHFGIAVETSDDMRQISVPNSRCYRSRDVEIGGDYTSASYILGAAFVTRGRITLTNLDPASAQGERAIIGILAELGADVRWGPARDTVHLDCTSLPSSVDAEFDLTDCPNILPTVAVIAATIPGRVRIVGGRLTQNHKSPRIEAIAAELRKVDVPVAVVTDEAGFIDGLEISGRAEYEGGAEFSDHDDHRIFMALSLFSLVSSEACSFGGSLDTEDSFPGFLEYLDLQHREVA
jgi:3-phosphoshikimate 1-carboxyvinyltransferase